MNTNQKRILIVAIALVACMLLYPPFHRVASNGAIFNMGYGWIFEPPGSNATVNVSILLTQWVGVIVVGGLGFFLAKASSVANSPSPKGIGGWLLLLVAGMMILGPLLGAGRIAGNIFAAENQFPALKESESWETYTTATWLIFFAAAAASVYGGWGLLRGKDWFVVSRAKLILWITGPAASLVLGVLVPKMTMGEWHVDAKVGGGLVASVVAAAIWTTYLSKSQRVRNTYCPAGVVGRNPEGIAQVRQTTPGAGTATPSNSGPSVPLVSVTRESDDWAYEKISEELESGSKDKATWTRAFANTRGDEKQATALYINLRVEKLKAVKAAAETKAATQIEEVASLEIEAPTVDPLASDGHWITLTVALAALLTLLIFAIAKSIDRDSSAKAVPERPLLLEAPRVEGPTRTPPSAPLAGNSDPSPFIQLIGALGPSALHAQAHKCLTCHSLDRTIIGPSFRDIAARYKGRTDVVNTLTGKVKNGGAGAWGTIPMPPNQNVPESDIREIVKSILKIG